MKKAWILLSVLAIIAVVGLFQVNETVAIGFCEVETNCGASCYCFDPHNAVVPAWCCPSSPCYDNRP